MKVFHKFIDRAGECWSWNFRSVRRNTWTTGSSGKSMYHRPQRIDTWQIIIVLSSYWSVSEKGDCIGHRCLEINGEGSPHIIRLKESATTPWDTKPDLFRRIS